MVRRPRVGADYGAFPVWYLGAPGGMVDASSLPISAELVARLEAWGVRFDATLNQDDPLQSGFPSPEAETTFDRDGDVLARALQAELGPEYQVHYGGRVV